MEANDYKELLSIVYLSGIVAQIGGVTSCSWHLVDNMGLDVKCDFWGAFDDLPLHTFLHIQLKATAVPVVQDGCYVLYLDEKTFDKYCELSCNGNEPFYVFLFVLPGEEESSTWIMRNKDQMTVRGQMYWAAFMCDEVESNANKLLFPKSNIVDKDGIKTLLRHYREEHRSGFSDEKQS